MSNFTNAADVGRPKGQAYHGREFGHEIIAKTKAMHPIYEAGEDG